MIQSRVVNGKPGLGRLRRAQGKVLTVFNLYPDHAQVVRVQFDEGVGSLVRRFDQALEGEVVYRLPRSVTAGAIVTCEQERPDG